MDCFQDVVFLPFRTTFYTTFLRNCVQVKTSGPPHVVGLWLGVSEGMLPVEYYGRGESHGTASCRRTVVGGKRGHAPCRIFPL